MRAQFATAHPFIKPSPSQIEGARTPKSIAIKSYRVERGTAKNRQLKNENHPILETNQGSDNQETNQRSREHGTISIRDVIRRP